MWGSTVPALGSQAPSVSSSTSMPGTRARISSVSIRLVSIPSSRMRSTFARTIATSSGERARIRTPVFWKPIERPVMRRKLEYTLSESRAMPARAVDE